MNNALIAVTAFLAACYAWLCDQYIACVDGLDGLRDIPDTLGTWFNEARDSVAAFIATTPAATPVAAA